MSNHLRGITAMKMSIWPEVEMPFVNACKRKSLTSTIEFLNTSMWQDRIQEVHLTLASHLSLWLSEPYLLNIFVYY
jgi:hypothetical protein